MPKFPIGRGYFTEVDDCDAELVGGLSLNCHVEYRDDRSIRAVYAYAYIPSRKRTVGLHRIILGLSDPAIHVDHANHDTLDNRRCNIRACTNSQNQSNSRLRSDNTSGHKGVTWNKKASKWEAKLMVSGKNRFCGFFDEISDAIQAYKDKAEEIFGDF